MDDEVKALVRAVLVTILGMVAKELVHVVADWISRHHNREDARQ